MVSKQSGRIHLPGRGPMKITLSVIKADIGSIGGHIRPRAPLLEAVGKRGAANGKWRGPAAAEMEFEERPNEAFLFFAADKTDPGAYSLPCYLAFADPMFNAGLILSPKIGVGYSFRLMDVAYTEGDRVIDLNAPEDLYDIAALLRDPERFAVESIRSRATGGGWVSVSTPRLHNIAANYHGKNDT